MNPLVDRVVDFTGYPESTLEKDSPCACFADMRVKNVHVKNPNSTFQFWSCMYASRTAPMTGYKMHKA